jgi:hypothetical protein
MNPLAKVGAWIWFTILLSLFLVFSYVSYSPNPQYYPDYVSDSPSPTGVKAFYTYVKKEKEGKIWRHSPDLLAKTDNQLLIMVEPSFTPDKEVMATYLNFMKAGNTILLLQSNPKGMFDLKIGADEELASSREKMKVFTQEQSSYKAQIHSSIRLQTNKEDEVILYDQAGTIAAKQTFGKGHLIVAIAPEWITNANLLNKDHLPLLLYLLNEGTYANILFDEYIHGGENESSFWNVYPMWFLLLVLQGIILMILWLWWKGKRFGPIIVAREETVRFSDEGIQALAAWYLRGKRYHDSLVIQADFVKLLLQEKWQIPYNREWKELLCYLERKWTLLPAKEISSFLTELESILKKEKISRQEYLLWSKKLDQLRKEVEK